MTSPAFRVFWTISQGGDRYPANGADQSDRVLSKNRRRERGTGEACIRCPCRSSNPATEIIELPHTAKTRPSGCGHRYRKGKKQGTGLRRSCLCFFFALYAVIICTYSSSTPQHILFPETGLHDLQNKTPTRQEFFFSVLLEQLLF